jgi:vacuolar protein sorting-associated protein 13A/C
MTAEQRKELYEALDYDEKSALIDSLQTPRDASRARVSARLKKGSLTLKTDPHGMAKEVISVIFDLFQADFIQRPDNFEVSISLGGFGVFDGTTRNSLYPQIVQVKQTRAIYNDLNGKGRRSSDRSDPFFFIKFENNPLDERADTALTVRMRQTEIIYHKGYVEAVYRFFKPPASQLESVEALWVCMSDSCLIGV